jgi:hypothetical protein
VSIDRQKGELPDIEYNSSKTVLLIKLVPAFLHLRGWLFCAMVPRAEAAATMFSRNAITSHLFFFWKFLSSKVRVSVFLTLSAGDPPPDIATSVFLVLSIMDKNIINLYIPLEAK